MLKMIKRLSPLPVTLAIAFLLIQVVCDLYIPTLTADMVNNGIVKGDTGIILQLGIVMILISLGGFAAALLNTNISARISYKLGCVLRKDIYRKASQFSNDEFDKIGTSSLITRNTNDVTQVQNLIEMFLKFLILAPLYLIGGVVMAYRLSPSLATIFIIVVPIVALAAIGISMYANPLYAKMQKTIDRLNLIFREGLNGVKVIRAFGKEKQEYQRYERENGEYTKTSIRVNAVVGLLMPIMSLVMGLATMAITWIGGQSIDSGSMEIGTMMGVIAYSAQIMTGFMLITNVISSIPRGVTSAKRIGEVLDMPLTICDAKNAKQTLNKEASLAFENVTYAYEGAEKNAVQDISFSIHKGQTLAIIGSTGSGKSTIVNLIPRLYDVSGGKIFLNDTDIQEIAQSTVQRAAVGNMKAPGQTNMTPQQKPEKMWKTVKRLMQYMKKSSFLIVLTLLIAIVGTLMQVFGPKILGNATTLIFSGMASGTGIDFSAVASILLVVGLLYAGTSVTNFLQIWIMTHVSQKTTYVLRNELKSKMNNVPISFFDKNSNGNLMSIAVNDMDNIATTLQQSLTQLISSVVLVVGTLWFMLTISPLLTLIAAMMIPDSFLVTKVIMPRAQSNFRKFFGQQGELNGHIEESYNAHAVIKSFNGEENANKKFDAYNDSMYESGWKSKFFGGSTMPSMLLMQNIIYVFIAMAGAMKVAAGRILIGDMQAFLQYSTQFSRPIAQFGQIWNGILSTVASAERVFAVLDAENLPEYKETFAGVETASKVKFKHVKFGYTDELLMRDFSLEVDKGQMIAIVGHTGAGKTTLINLVERFYEISGGSIFLDGVDIRNMDYHTLRSKIGMVLQDTWLFSGTIYDNIRYGNENAADEQIYAAAKAAYVDDFVRKLPDGYNTVLNEEAGNISGGQCQLITIARAFVSNPDILILDEATSNVDSRTEILIQKAMGRLLKGRTSFVVAHRLSTIYDADNIIVMKDGDIVETGNHGSLIAADGTYTDIYNSQFAQRSA